MSYPKPPSLSIESDAVHDTVVTQSVVYVPAFPEASPDADLLGNPEWRIAGTP